MLSFPFLHYFAKKMSEKKKSVACVANMFSFQFSGLTHTLLPRTFTHQHILLLGTLGSLEQFASQHNLLLSKEATVAGGLALP